MRQKQSHSLNMDGLRNGIFYFLTFLLLIQGLRHGIYLTFPTGRPPDEAYVDLHWQSRIDSLAARVRAAESSGKSRRRNANSLDDYAGYRLGLRAAALDSLYRYQSRYGDVPSLEVFGSITGVTGDSLAALGKQLYFPGGKPDLKTRAPGTGKRNAGHFSAEPVPIDLNRATANQLRQISGIGSVRSRRILKFRKALGGFLHESQLLDVYGLPESVAREAMKRFRVYVPPEVPRLNINTASVEELAALVYLDWQMARDIVHRRTVVGPYTSIDEITEVESIPADKIGRIALYLTL